MIFSPECSGKHFEKIAIFSWRKTTTKGSSFFDLEKSNCDKILERKAGLASKKKRLERNAFDFFVVYSSSKVSLRLTLNSVTLPSFTAALCSCTYIERMCFTDFDAFSTAFFVASSQLVSELERTSITFRTAMIFGF
jgi:hypothetical protein